MPVGPGPSPSPCRTSCGPPPRTAPARWAPFVALLLVAAPKSSVHAQLPGSADTPAPVECTPPRGTRAAPVAPPWEWPPTIRNAEEVERRLREAYTSSMRAAGLQGTTRVGIFVQHDGRTVAHHVAASSLSPRLDAAALSVAEGMEFTPPRIGDCPRGVWVTIPLTFRMSSRP